MGPVALKHGKLAAACREAAAEWVKRLSLSTKVVSHAMIKRLLPSALTDTISRISSDAGL
jgi:hypothetical protein